MLCLKCCAEVVIDFFFLIIIIILRGLECYLAKPHLDFCASRQAGKKKKSGKGKNFNYTLGELLEMTFGKTKTRETWEKYLRHLGIGGNSFPPWANFLTKQHPVNGQKSPRFPLNPVRVRWCLQVIPPLIHISDGKKTVPFIQPLTTINEAHLVHFWCCFKITLHLIKGK